MNTIITEQIKIWGIVQGVGFRPFVAKIADRLHMVTLLGEVYNPHRRIWNQTLGLLELIAESGGLKETYWRYAVIMRGPVTNQTYYRADLDEILLGKKPNIMLEPGDIVYVPRDNISEYNVFIRKLMPTGQLINLYLTPGFFWLRFM